jgi:hypothetical protein
MENNILSNSFFTTKKNIIKFHILSFLEQEEKFISRNINSTFFKAYKEYLTDKKNEIINLITSRKIELEYPNEKVTIIESIKNKIGYLIKNTRANYMQIFFNTFQHLALTRGEVWAHFDNPSYWNKVKLENSTFGGETFYLKNVCWLDLNINFNYVIPAKYDVYLRQGMKGKVFNLNNGLTLSIIADYFDVNEAIIKKVELYKTNFMSDEIIKSLKNEILVDTFITQIDIRSLPISPNDFVKVKIAFFHINGYWKSGWYIDGGILRKSK